jgi:hypothetical protein
VQKIVADLFARFAEKYNMNADDLNTAILVLGSSEKWVQDIAEQINNNFLQNSKKKFKHWKNIQAN